MHVHAQEELAKCEEALTRIHTWRRTVKKVREVVTSIVTWRRTNETRAVLGQAENEVRRRMWHKNHRRRVKGGFLVQTKRTPLLKVVAVSPTTIMVTNKGIRRAQYLQLHRHGHQLLLDKGPARRFARVLHLPLYSTIRLELLGT
ncbi:hypothetical protein MPTK1_8g01130 [Marchantia polymorpha subsp. ruderalis]|uniref:Uncharacterized protein n=1 Tax=Marchantia polymorpha TaxID=3197 RepID=A0A2R6WRB6_MARPO|nr:hypothetical protein MARPO_0064s0085 [Marchantia polymorpha]BBN18264.1 hypothetical protein Mp_8g01130 [Marchantia polymorpha subsp. ruderalis]|eukprot:PTQ36408.1 hypothetical protein MARPO_0064s0085 [Marchantia polymorpha]